LRHVGEERRIEVAELHNVEQGLFFPGSGDGLIVGDSILDNGAGADVLAAEGAEHGKGAKPDSVHHRPPHLLNSFQR
jgi:hypothetical protein